MTKGRKQLRRWLLGSLCLSAVVGISDRPAVGQSKEVDALVTSRMAKTQAPGMAVAVTVGHKRIHVKGYGIANLETQARVTERTAFNLQSITKTFTALAAMKLVETGKLSLEDPLSIHLDNIPVAWKEIGRASCREQV